ncbi:hypothetical protein M2163_001020 [Streptomyces sp. SAI-135]|nr:hypothetical protein [Streptomyces sp. SAI-090]MDH6573354.1 hypothetical protein [Streptomyces sp. SAI-117]MDH6613912.1 hypothetical protein [Streptomyces sp. SAI-135]
MPAGDGSDWYSALVMPGPAPRALGDGPAGSSVRTYQASCSPRPRGWPHPRHQAQPLRGLLPGPAGMVPRCRLGRRERCPVPHAGGDSPADVVPGGHTGDLLPTSAGPTGPTGAHRRETAPRVRGRVPALSAPRRSGSRARRGRPGRALWCGSVGTSSRSAPRAREDGPPDRFHLILTSSLLPAPAGMVPPWVTPWGVRRSAPRTRRDGPWNTPRGLFLMSCSPRPRGWSRYVQGLGVYGACSPRTRGWSRGHRAREAGLELLPAPRGWSPRHAGRVDAHALLPAPRGDGPDSELEEMFHDNCSPHPRG